jgi:hypothetical protein
VEPQTLINKLIDGFVKCTKAFLGSMPTLAEEVSSSPGPVFLLIPAKGKSVRVVQSCFLPDSQTKELFVVGIAGTRKTSPFKIIHQQSVVKPMRATSKTRDSSPFAPVKGAFDHVRSIEDFKIVKGGQKDTGENIVDKIPNSFLIHPSFFLDHIGGKTIGAADLTVSIILDTMGGYRKGDSPSLEEHSPTHAFRDSYDLLTFLWCVENNLASHVTLEDVPNDDLIESQCVSLLSHLAYWESRLDKNHTPFHGDVTAEHNIKDSTKKGTSKGIVPTSNRSPRKPRDGKETKSSSSEALGSPIRKGRPTSNPDSESPTELGGAGTASRNSPFDGNRSCHDASRKRESKKNKNSQDTPKGRSSPKGLPGKGSGVNHYGDSDSTYSSDRSRPRRANRERTHSHSRRGSAGDSTPDKSRNRVSRNSGPPRHEERSHRDKRSKTLTRNTRVGRNLSPSGSSSSSSSKSSESRGRRRGGRQDSPSSGSQSSSSTRREHDHREKGVNRPSRHSPGNGKQGNDVGRGDSRSRSRSPRRYPGNRRGGGRRNDGNGDRDNRRRPNGRRETLGREDNVAANYNAIIASHVAKLTEAQLEDKRRDERKRSMLSRLSPEQAALFKLISARDWEDYDPVINPFTTKLIEDKDLTKAIDTIASELRRWPGQVSHRQLAAFLSGGYAATDVTKSPGGFTLFMFRPKSARFARSPEEERNAIRSMFGETKLDDESVRFYSKKDFFLAGSLPELEEQLRTAIEFLSLLTCERGIAVAGYNFGLRFLLENRPVFLEVIERKPIFCTEYAYMLDNVFQSFLYKLGRFYLEQNPIREARQLLKSYQRKSIEGTMRGFEYGAVPQLRLPSSLTSSVVSGGGPSVKKSLSATAAPPPSRSLAKEPPKD